MTVIDSEGIAIHLEEWPIVRMVYPRDGTIAELDAYFDRLPELIARARREGPMYYITDMQAVSIVASTAQKRRHFSDRISEFLPALKTAVAADAVIAGSVWMKASVRAVHLFSPPTWKWKLFSNEENGRVWIMEQRAQDGR